MARIKSPPDKLYTVEGNPIVVKVITKKHRYVIRNLVTQEELNLTWKQGLAVIYFLEKILEKEGRELR